MLEFDSFTKSPQNYYIPSQLSLNPDSLNRDAYTTSRTCVAHLGYFCLLIFHLI